MISSALNSGAVKCWIPKWAYCLPWIRTDEQRMICRTSVLKVLPGSRITPNVGCTLFACEAIVFLRCY